MNIQTYPMPVAAVVALSGKTASERKMSALDNASHTALVLLSHGKGKLAKMANEARAPIESMQAAVAIANGDYQSFAVAYAGKTGNDVRFGLKDQSGQWVRKPAADFRKFGAVLEHAQLQLEAKNKVYTAKGDYTTAAADLLGLISLHDRAVALMDARDQRDAARREEQRIEDELLTLEAIEAALPVGDTELAVAAL